MAAATAAAAEAAAAAVAYENWKRCGVETAVHWQAVARLGPVARGGARAPPRVGAAPLLAARLAAHPAAARLAPRGAPRLVDVARLVDAAAARADGVAAAVGSPHAAVGAAPPARRVARHGVVQRRLALAPRLAPRLEPFSEDVGPAAVGALLAGPQRPAVSQRIEYEGAEPAAPTRPPNWAKGGGAAAAPAQAPAAAGSVAARLSGRSPRLSNRPKFADEEPPFAGKIVMPAAILARAEAVRVREEGWKRFGAVHVKLRYIGKLSIGMGRWLEDIRARRAVLGPAGPMPPAAAPVR